ncbi:MAG: nicotinate-nucleotide adenylyltransferase [Oscillospiraceae bacterium]
MNKIAIYGGTFNPIHNGHINLCNGCQQLYNFDKIVLIPTNIPPHKNAVDLASNIDRFNMLKLAVSNIANFEVSDIEFKLGAKSYTINTILELKNQHLDAEFYLIIGSDMLRIFQEWHRYEDVLKEVTLVVGARHEAEFDELLTIKSHFGSLSMKIDIVNINVVDVSSTDIREKLSKNESISKLVNYRVEDYINKNHLYTNL